MVVHSYRKLKNCGRGLQEIKEIGLVAKILISSGRGDFWIHSCDKKPIIYCLVYCENEDNVDENGVKEFTLEENSKLLDKS